MSAKLSDSLGNYCNFYWIIENEKAIKTETFGSWLVNVIMDYNFK